MEATQQAPGQPEILSLFDRMAANSQIQTLNFESLVPEASNSKPAAVTQTTPRGPRPYKGLRGSTFQNAPRQQQAENAEVYTSTE